MNICSNCRFWDKYSFECLLPDWVDRTTKMDNTSFGFYAYSLDDTGLNAGVKTGPNFGCIKFELPKKNK